MPLISKSVTAEDQLFIDGTFRVCPENITQMITLSIKKREWSCEIPTVFNLVQYQSTQTYLMIWTFILMLAPSIRKVSQLSVSVDFEQAMHNAIRTRLPKAVIVGCEFHLKQAIFRYVFRGNAGKNVSTDFKNDRENREDLKSRLSSMIDAQTPDDFKNEKNKFIEFYSMKQHYVKFVNYMKRTWLGKDDGKPAAEERLIYSHFRLRRLLLHQQRINSLRVLLLQHRVKMLYLLITLVLSSRSLRQVQLELEHKTIHLIILHSATTNILMCLK